MKHWQLLDKKLKCHHNDAITIQSLWNSNANLHRVNFIYIPKFILIEHKRAEIQRREVNKEFWRKMDVTSLSTILIWFEPEQQATILQEKKIKMGASVRLYFDGQTNFNVRCRKIFIEVDFFKRKSDYVLTPVGVVLCPVYGLLNCLNGKLSSSQHGWYFLLQTLCVYLCVCVCVCVCVSSFTAYISVIMGQILIKLDWSVGRLVWLMLY